MLFPFIALLLCWFLFLRPEKFVRYTRDGESYFLKPSEVSGIIKTVHNVGDIELKVVCGSQLYHMRFKTEEEANGMVAFLMKRIDYVV
jgi:hypothetical protein